MKTIDKQIYKIIFDIFLEPKNTAELKINENLCNNLMFLISILYNNESKNNRMNIFQNIIDIYDHLYNKDLDILDISEKEMDENNIKENINWIKICLLNRVKYEVDNSMVKIDNDSDIERFSQIILNNQNYSKNNTNNNQSKNINNDYNQNATNNTNNNLNQNMNFPFQALSFEQQKKLQSKLQFFNPYDSTPKIIPIIKKIIGGLSILLIILSILFPIAYLNDISFLNWVRANQATPLPPVSSATSSDWVRNFAMQLPYFLVYGFLTYFLLRKPKSLQEKYMVSGIFFGIFLVMSIFDLITFGLSYKTFVQYLKPLSDISSHIFLLIVLSLTIVSLTLFILTLGIALYYRPKINKAKLANFIQKEVNDLRNERQ